MSRITISNIELVGLLIIPHTTESQRTPEDFLPEASPIPEIPKLVELRKRELEQTLYKKARDIWNHEIKSI